LEKDDKILTFGGGGSLDLDVVDRVEMYFGSLDLHVLSYINMRFGRLYHPSG